MASVKKIQRIVRKFLVCGKRIYVKVYQDGYCKRGYYFGVIKTPIGKDEYKKVRTSKIAGRKFDVVKWTGKEKEVEYWECNKCFEEASHETGLEQMLKKLYGEKCKNYERLCGCCQSWSVYDTIIEHNRGRL